MEIPKSSPACIVTDRGGIVESRHQVHAAVVDTDGRLLYTVGNPDRVTLARSTAKPAQALAVLETPKFDQFGFDDEDLALMCASHSSEDRHIARARNMLAKADASESHLACGGHAAISEAVNHAWIKSGYVPTAICNNCSGKHAGMMAGARALGAEVAGYHLAEHPMQVHTMRIIEELYSSKGNFVKWGVDGCNLPAPAAPLSDLARVYAYFAAAADTVESTKAPTSRIQASSRIYHAMSKHSELVGGDGRFCTELMTAAKGGLIGKIGADGCYTIGVRASQQTKRLGANSAIGIAVKIEDGDLNILYAAVLEILKQLELGPQTLHQSLANFHRQTVANTAGVVTGRVFYEMKIIPVVA